MNRSRLIVFFVAAVLFGWLFREVLFGGGMFAFRDGAHFYYPLLQLVTDEWAAGRVPLWNPYENLGQPLAGNPTSGVFYPGLLVFALPCGFAWCYRLYVLGHLVLAAIGMYCLARRFDARVPASGMAALAYAFSGNVLYQYCNVVFLVGAAWLPVAMTVADRMLRGRKPGCAVALGMVLSLMVLGGDPQMAYHAGLLATAYAAWLWWTERATRVRQSGKDSETQNGPPPQAPPGRRFFPEQNRGRWRNRFALLALAAASALLLSVVQVLPSIQYAAQSSRDPGRIGDRLLCRIEPGTHAEHTYHFSVGPWRLAEYVWPNVFGRQFPVHRRWIGILPAEGRVWVPSMYMGLFPLVLALAAFRKRKGGQDGGRESRAGAARAVRPERTASEENPAPQFFRWVVLAAVVAAFGWYGVGWLVNEVALGVGLDPNGGGPLPCPVGGLYWLMSVVLPGYAYFRYPAKLMVVAGLGLSLLAAAGFDRAFGESSPRLRRGLAWLGGLSALAGLGAVAMRPWWGGWMAGAVPDILFGPLDAAGAANDLAWAFGQTALLCGVLWWLLGLSHRLPGARWPAMVAVVVAAIDLAVANQWMVVAAPASLWREPPALAAAIDRHVHGHPAKTPTRVYRHPLWLPSSWRESASTERFAEAVRWDRDTLWPKYPLLHRLAVTEVHGTMMPGDYREVLGAGKSSGDVFQLSEYAVLRAEDGLPGGRPIEVPTVAVSLWHNPGALPRAWIERSRVEETFAPRSAPVAGESCEIVRYGTTRVEIQATLAEPGWVVLADQFYPGWCLELQTDGRPSRSLKIERTRQVMRGARLDPGRHQLVYRYRPRGVLVGAVLSGLGWLVVVGWGLVAVVVGRRPRISSSRST